MTLKQRALLDVFTEAAKGAIFGAVVVLAAKYLGLAIAGIAVSVVILAYLIKLGYDIRVQQLELEQSRIERALKDGR